MTWNKMIIIHHTCLTFISSTQKNVETTNDDIHLGGIDDYGRTSYPYVNLNLSTSDEEEPKLSRPDVHSGREAHTGGRFQRMEKSRGQLLDVMRSCHNTEPTYGDALVILKSLPIKPMDTFWWEENKLFMNDEDIRDGFMKLRSEENKFRHLERLSGVDRYGNPCELVNLRVASSTSRSGHVVEGLWEEVLMVEDLMEIKDFS
ncbi:unnamed protein product [Eruca vesicaria subsp. sativa]|uniref:Uncharacterized protein n=1 Tax=Eruca vesicaria subsp. sativa TaxID=29727 RepID=A0ABC8J5T8_ERUVS|nr:unnamed protein product [Eruca vesicaria subsp. sativa]